MAADEAENTREESRGKHLSKASAQMTFRGGKVVKADESNSSKKINPNAMDGANRSNANSGSGQQQQRQQQHQQQHSSDNTNKFAEQLRETRQNLVLTMLNSSKDRNRGADGNSKESTLVTHLTHLKKLYNVWALDFEADMLTMAYRGPELVARLIKSSLRLKSTARILDFFCGTGLLGVELERRGFGQIVGIDLSDNMVRIANKKACYVSCRTVQPAEELRESFDLIAYCSPLENSDVIALCAAKLMHNFASTNSRLVVAQPLARHMAEAVAARRFAYDVKSTSGLRPENVITVREYLKASTGVIAVFSAKQ